jgi:hypothetical protein
MVSIRPLRGLLDQREAPLAGRRESSCSLGETWLLHDGDSVTHMTVTTANRSFLPWFCLRRRSGAHNVSVYCLGWS